MASYTEKQKTKIINDICKGIESGLSLRTVIESVTITMQTFYDWINKDDAKIDQYTQAREVRQDKIFEEIMEIADNTIEGQEIIIKADGKKEIKKGDMLGHRRLQIDSRKWMLGKMNPKKYGEKLDLTSDNEKIAAPTIIVTSQKAKDNLEKLANEDD